MKALIAIALAGGALYMLEQQRGFGGGSSAGGGAGSDFGGDDIPPTLGDGKFTAEEKTFCDVKIAAFEAMQSEAERQGVSCIFKPNDPICKRIAELRGVTMRCENELIAHELSQGRMWKAIKGAIGDALGFVLEPFGDLGWILIAGGLVYLVVLR